MKKLNLRKGRWMIRELHKRDLSVWQIARQQGVSARHARRLRQQFSQPKDYTLKPCGRRPQPATREQEQLILSLHEQYGCGARSLENHVNAQNRHIPHNKIHAVLLKHGLAKQEPKKQKRRKWVRYERRHSNSLWHADWKEWNGKQLIVFEDDASRFITGWGLFDSASAENSLQVFAVAVDKYGAPKQLLTDNGSHFCNAFDKKDLRHVFHGGVAAAGVQHVFTRVKHPQCNGKNERVFRTLNHEAKRLGSMEKAVEFYNCKRPHMSLRWEALETPIMAFQRKKRKS